MQDYAIQKSSRKCHASARVLQPGERYISAIVQAGKDLLRRDFSLAHWSGPSDSTIGWWQTSVPPKKSSGPQLAPPIVLVDTLSALLETPGQDELAYLLSLLLVRRKILVDASSMDGSASAPFSDSPQQEVDNNSLHLKFPTDDRTFYIPITEITPERSQEQQSKLLELLYTEE